MTDEIIWGIDFTKPKDIHTHEDAVDALAKELSAMLGEEVTVERLNADAGYIAPPCDCA